MIRLKRLILLAVCCLAAGPLPAGAAENHSWPVLDDLVAEALANNPDIKAAEARWHLYENKQIPAGSLEDPTLSFAFNNYPVDSLEANDFAMSGKVFKLSQKFPFPGKLAAREELAAQQALWYKGVFDDGRLQLIRAVKETYYALYFTEKSLEVTDKNLGLVADIIRLTETNYEVGKGPQQDVLKAQVEKSRLMDRILTLKQKRASLLAQFNSLLSRPLAPPNGELPELAPPPVPASTKEFKDRAEHQRPLFTAYRALIKRYLAQQKLARLKFKPDFKMGLAYTQRENNPADNGTDFVAAEFGFTLPIYRAKRYAEMSEAASGLRMAKKQLDNFRNTVAFQIDDAHARLKKNADLARLYRDGIIPQASQSFQASLSAYRVGKTSLLTLLDNLMILFRYEVDYYRAVTDALKNQARLAAEAGTELTNQHQAPLKDR